jgi:FkbM family methyltransferase
MASLEHEKVPFGKGFATVLDVGSSRGQFALFAAERFPGATIHCFEPLPEAFDTLKQMLADGPFEVHPVALGAERGTMELNVSGRDDSSSLLPIGSSQVELFPGTERARVESVTVDVLESYLGPQLARPCLLKLDVQGYELAVLEGAGEALDRVDEAFVECSFVELYEGQALASEVIGRLAQHGLRLVDVSGLVRASDGSAIQADFLFRR